MFCVKEFLELAKLNTEVKESLKRTVAEFMFFNNLFVKYNEIIQKLKISSHLDRKDRFCKMTDFYVSSHWMLFVMAGQSLLGTQFQMNEYTVLLGSVLVEMLLSEDLISNYLINSKNSTKINSDFIFQIISQLLAINSKEKLVKSHNALCTFVKKLQSEGILPQKWNSVNFIQQSAETLETVYQKILVPSEIDLRFYSSLKKEICEKTSAKRTPISKQKCVYKQFQQQAINTKPRVLEFDSTFNDVSKVEVFSAPSNFNGVNDTVLQKMAQSPYKAPHYSPSSPLTKNMELYGWLSEKVSHNFVTQDGHLKDEKINTPLGRFVNNLDAELQHKILKEIVQEKVDLLLEMDFPKSVSSKIRNFEKKEERRVLFLNFFFSFLQSFIVREEQLKNKSLDLILKSTNFHKTLLVFSIETIFFVLNVPHLDFESILDLVELPFAIFYENNIKKLNFENFVPLQIKNHFFEIEKLILSFHLWEKPSPIFKNELDEDNMLIFERALSHASRIINSIGQRLKFPANELEKVWDLFKEIMSQKRIFLMQRFLEQIILCCFYLISKICNLGIKFQEIISNAQKCLVNFSAVLFNSVIMECTLLKNQKGDIITFYNQVFICECETIIQNLRNKFLNPENSSLNANQSNKDCAFTVFKSSSPSNHSKKKQFEFQKNKDKEFDSEKLKKNFWDTGIVSASVSKTVQLLKSPLKDLLSTPFHFYSKEISIFTPSNQLKSPTSMMMKMASPNGAKMPVNSKKILNLKIDNFKEDFSKKDRLFEKKDQMSNIDFEKVEEKFKRFM